MENIQIIISPNGLHSIELCDCDEACYNIITSTMHNCYTISEDYKMKQKANPFLQGDNKIEGERWIFIEFWTEDMPGIVEFVVYLYNKIKHTKWVNIQTKYPKEKRKIIAELGDHLQSQK
jgi:hypothetical protein